MAVVSKSGARQIRLIRTLELLQEHITAALCGAVFQQIRTKERQREWSLYALVQFWTAVILRAPVSLTHALSEAQQGREPLVPRVRTSSEAFFERCRDLSWEFFAEVFRRFVGQLVETVPPRYCSQLCGLEERFTAVLIIDGSRCAAMARRLKILWNERAVVLPGCILGVYDLFRGIPRHLYFCADAAKAEMTRAKEALEDLPSDSLLVGDRLYCAAAFFAALSDHDKHLWGLFRRNKSLGVRRQELLRKKRYQGGILQEWRVSAGSGQKVPAQTLRLIRFKKGRKVYELLTNVLDLKRLTAEEALDLYPCRWQVERMYYDLKEVLNLNRFYPANPNAVGMQVYAAAIVYAAMRVAQGEVAEQVGIEPEEISPAKFFPKMAAACSTYAARTQGVAEVVRLNPGVALRLPTWKRARFAQVSLDAILVEKRSEHRRKRRFCKARRQWKSLMHVRGGSKLT